ncbi:class I SAM-dependent methyltransferase [Tuwongella immobilis]|uniref:Methyltransferase domain-containing protein n=1 Tax=Tuwongella immobilis TaxID=692036 RepID=A0A6C2YMI8_9BACT|nr:methyltransferase domain-containing protein [Tuwongella immobilis]VIP02577.1 methyltransferase type 11 : Methyltransferase type 11 OS=Pedosphaera parvula (strain Ellin514) GN=Cflav_PD3075 PE=4 SV=1: Methyltransf_31 [Tuwongella immobilis]VTS01820.1 methyltransferase type 11 : Methyltransferase type 11 OS=Pedosphaera parvula (strain Ellin514) GN=Cflav_PD3075 PE=4 SV=1: Methyltransf_31 [Tuwongella immobilis]
MLRWTMPLIFCVVGSSGFAAEPEKPAETRPAEAKYEFRKFHDPNGIGKFYMGREIAQVMGHQGADWLDRPEREDEENPTVLHELLKIRPGDSVADIGAGSGYHTFRMAKFVGPKGKVYAVEIQPEMLAIIRKRAKESRLDNIELVLGTENNPKLPDNSQDLILLVDVYHEFAEPYEMTAAMVKALKPGGRIAFVEFRLEDPRVPIKLVHKMSERQVIREMSLFPEMKHKQTIGKLPWQHLVIFEKAGANKPMDDPKKPNPPENK